MPSTATASASSTSATSPWRTKAAVELSKGLSALRYGATSPRGTVNYVVKPDGLLARLRLYGDGHGTYGAHADLRGRFGGGNQFGVRVNAAWEEPDTGMGARHWDVPQSWRQLGRWIYRVENDLHCPRAGPLSRGAGLR